MVGPGSGAEVQTAHLAAAVPKATEPQHAPPQPSSAEPAVATPSQGAEASRASVRPPPGEWHVPILTRCVVPALCPLHCKYVFSACMTSHAQSGNTFSIAAAPCS